MAVSGAGRSVALMTLLMRPQPSKFEPVANYTLSVKRIRTVGSERSPGDRSPINFPDLGPLITSRPRRPPQKEMASNAKEQAAPEAVVIPPNVNQPSLFVSGTCGCVCVVGGS